MRAPGSPALRAVLLVLVLAAVPLAGCVGSNGGTTSFLKPLASTLATPPGGSVEFPIVVSNPGSGATNVVLDVQDAGGLDVHVPANLTVPANGTRGLFLAVAVPLDASTGVHRVTLHAAAGNDTATVHVTVKVAPSDPRVEPGQTALVNFVGHLADGTILVTNVGPVSNASIPKVASYQVPSTFAPVPVPTDPNSSTSSTFRNAIIGLGVGQSTTITLSPGQAYGNVTLTHTRSRNASIPRNLTDQRVLHGLRQQFSGFVNASSQVGDRVYFPFGRDQIPFNITALGSRNVTLTMAVHLGQTFSVFSAWPNGTVVAKLNDTSVIFRITPTTPLDQNFTFYSYWPNMTRIVGLNSTTIVLRSSPPVGYQFDEATQQGQVTHYTVVSSDATNLTLGAPNPSPFAGQTITFDLTVLRAS